MLHRVRVPSELKQASPNVLEGYVRQRIEQYNSLLSQRLSQYVPGLSREALDTAAREVLAYLPTGDHGQLSLEDKQLQLVFRHDCLALGCLDPQCPLCTHNPSRRCTVNFDRKYLVNDVLKARCGAGIRVELIDPLTAQPVEERLPELTLQISVLDGNLYDTKFLDSGKQYEGGTEPAEELDACALLQNKKKSTPLLVCGSGGFNDTAGYVLMSMVDGKVPLNDLHVTDSSEAILSGRKPPFRLLVRAILPPNGPKLNIRHAVSEGFVVATRRTRTAGKAEIPSVDDPVSKLEHMGKETVKKLADLASAAEQAGVEIDIPENCVQKVGEFKMLALRADQDGHLRQKLQHVLKLSKEKWDEARDHAMRAVVADNRMRAWYAGRSCELGVLFTARMGNVDLERPVGLLQTRIEAGERKTEAILVAQLNPNQREMLRNMQPQAVTAWWAPGHTGWAIFPMDSDTFQNSGTLAAATGGPTTLATAPINTAPGDQPSSPTQSAVSLNTMSQSQRRQTGCSGGGDGGGTTTGGGGGLAMGSTSTEVVLPPDTAQMGRQLSLGNGIGLSALHGGLSSLPTPFNSTSLPTAFGAGMGSGRSSRAGSITDSPPRSVPMQHPQVSLNNHHSLPQPPHPHGQPALPQHLSVQGMSNLPNMSGLQQLSSYHSLQSQPGIPGLAGPPQHPSLQPHGSHQSHSSLQQHPSLHQHPGQRQGPATQVGGGRAGSFTSIPGQVPPSLGGMHPHQHSQGPEVGLPSGSMMQTNSASLPQHLMPPPPPHPMGSGRTMMLPPQGPAFRMPPPAQPMPQHQMSQHQHAQFRSPQPEPYPQGQLMQQGPMGHLSSHPDAAAHGHSRQNGIPNQQQQHPSHPAMQHRVQSYEVQQHHHQGRSPLSQQQRSGPGGHLSDTELGQMQLNVRMQAPGSGANGQPGRQQLPLPHHGGRGPEDGPSDDLPSRGSANPRPHKMPSLGRSLDVNFLVPAVETSSSKPDAQMARNVVAADGSARAVETPASAPAPQSAPPSAPGSAREHPRGERSAMAEKHCHASGGSPNQSKQQFSVQLQGAPSAGSGLPPGLRTAVPVPGQSPPGTSPPPPGPPPNPFARVQSSRMNGASTGLTANTDDSDSDDSLDLGALPLTNSTILGLGAPSMGVVRTAHPGGAVEGAGNGGGAGLGGGGAGQVPPGGLNGPLPSLHMLDSQQLDQVLAGAMIYETPSLNTNISGLFGYNILGSTQSKELLKPTSSGLLKPTTSGLDTMASMELALPGVRKSDAPPAGQEPKASGSAAGNMAMHAPMPAVGMGVVSNRMLGPYAR